VHIRSGDSTSIATPFERHAGDLRGAKMRNQMSATETDPNPRPERPRGARRLTRE
jgi:hypothetical protein